MKKMLSLIVVMTLTVLVACNNEQDTGDNKVEELKMLEVDFEVAKVTTTGVPVELKASVIYGEDKVKDADEVVFEYWEESDQDRDESVMVDAENNGDGTYTAEVVFDHEGVFEIYAHTTARGLHTMPKKAISVE